MLAERPDADVHRREGAADDARTGPGLAEYPQVSQALQQATPTSSPAPARPTRPAAYQKKRGVASSAGRTRLPPAERPAAVRAATPAGVGRRRAGRGRAVGFVAPALVLIGVFLVFPALWTLYLGLTDFRLTGAAARRPAVRRARQLHRRADRPDVLQLAVADAAVRARLGGHRAERARLPAGVGAARPRPRRSGASSRRWCCWPGSCPARWSRSCGSRCWTATAAPSTRCSARRRGLAGRVPDGRHHRVQHLARHRVLDDALRRRADQRAAVAAGDGAAGRRQRRADAARRGLAAHPRAHADQHAADHAVDVQRLHAVPAHRRRPEPASRRSCRSTSTTRAIVGGEMGYGGGDLAARAADQPGLALVYLRLLRERGSRA